MISTPGVSKNAPLFSRVDEDGDDPTPIVLGSSSEERLARELARYPSNLFVPLEVNLGGSAVYHLALHREWRFLEGREKQRSAGSCAEYLAALVRGRRAYLIQVIKPKRFRRARTSGHRHRWKEESWALVAGVHPIFSDDGVGKQVLERMHTAPPGVLHQLEMRPAFFRLIRALVLMKITDYWPGPPDPLGMDDYVYA